MTIDEAQIMLKAKAKCIERICKGIYEDCNEQKCDNCDLCYVQGTNGDQIKLLRKCAEWLEELKAIKSDGFTDDLLNMGFTKGYNKAIDDFVKMCDESKVCETYYCVSMGDIRHIAELLKAGVESGTDNQ